MEFSSKEDVNATRQEVFAILSNFDAIERQALRRGLDIRRVTPVTQVEPGMRWTAEFSFRGRNRKSEVCLIEFESPERMVFDSHTGGLGASLTVDLIQLSKSRTRITVNVVLNPNTLSARLLVQSMKLAKGKITRTFAVRMSQFARDVEERAARLS